LNKSVNFVDSKIKTNLETKEEKIKICVQFILPEMFLVINNKFHKENKLITSCLNKLCLHFI